MTPQEELEIIRWKTADAMSDHDVEVLLANKDQLNEEEKTAFSTLLNPLVEDPNKSPLENAIDASVGQEPLIPATTIPVEPVVPIVPTPPVLPDNVVTQDKLDAYIEGKRKEWEAAGKTVAEQKVEQEKIEKIFDEGYQPKDWNEYSTQFLAKLTPIIEKQIFDKLEKQEKEKADAREQMTQAEKKIFDSFEQEFTSLAVGKLIPDPKEKPDEYKKVHDAIIAIGDQHGKRTVTDAYKLWSIIPVSKGGGLDYQPGVQVDSQAKIAAQKAAAGRIGKASGGVAPAKPSVPDAHKIHNTSMDDLLEERLARM